MVLYRQKYNIGYGYLSCQCFHIGRCLSLRICLWWMDSLYNKASVFTVIFNMYIMYYIKLLLTVPFLINSRENTAKFRGPWSVSLLPYFCFCWIIDNLRWTLRKSAEKWWLRKSMTEDRRGRHIEKDRKGGWRRKQY